MTHTDFRLKNHKSQSANFGKHEKLNHRAKLLCMSEDNCISPLNRAKVLNQTHIEVKLSWTICRGRESKSCRQSNDRKLYKKFRSTGQAKKISMNLLIFMNDYNRKLKIKRWSLQDWSKFYSHVICKIKICSVFSLSTKSTGWLTHCGLRKTNICLSCL